MRIVAVADTHTFEADLVVPDGDVFVHAGDLCRGGTLDELAPVAAWIRSLPHRHKVVVPGNHDWAFATEPDAARAMLDGVTVLIDEEVTLDGVRFWGAPWQPEYHRWAFNLPRGAALAARWALVPEGTDVLVTHGPPAGIGDGTTMPGRAGCRDLLARVRAVSPALHVFGHIHEGGGSWREGDTLFANVTTWECERAPTVVDLARDGGRVVAQPAYVPPREGRWPTT